MVPVGIRGHLGETTQAQEPPKQGAEKKSDDDTFAKPSKRRVVRASGLMTAPAKKAVASGLKFLKESQHTQGSFGSGQYSENIAITSLSALAMMSAGSMPEEGPYSREVNLALDFVLKNTGPSGFVCVQRSTSHGPMYDHGFGTLFLAEAYGMTRRDDIREKLKKAVQLIVDTQNREGGWRYQPKREPQADVSVTICQIMALRAARNAGIHVPRSTVDRCVDYVRKCQNPDGGFRYMLQPLGASQFPRSAAGVVTFHSAGIYEGKEIDKGLEYIMDYLPSGGGEQFRGFRGANYHYFYGHYYAVQAMFQAGGDYWARWYPAIRDDLVTRQQTDGHWDDNFGSEYATAMACIILQMPNSVLPIFQH
jgi:prenyltransferase beta subunit